VVTMTSTLAKALFCFSKGVISRNRRYMNLHAGESCYIFGNGVSLKGMDLSVFSDQVAIGCNSFFFHKDFSKINCYYYTLPAPFLLYRYAKYYGKWQRNHIGELFRDKIRVFQNTIFFTNLSNIFACRSSNIRYLHHFGNKKWSFSSARLDGIFGFMQGAFFSMIGLAYLMGFRKLGLIGCDYVFHPRRQSHFFEKGKGVEIQEDCGIYAIDFLKECEQFLDLEIIVPPGTRSQSVRTKDYEKLSGKPYIFRENTEIVSMDDLEKLAKQRTYNVFSTY
jgi:hypothetical protein